jgi:hypothetical protein
MAVVRREVRPAEDAWATLTPASGAALRVARAYLGRGDVVAGQHVRGDGMVEVLVRRKD